MTLEQITTLLSLVVAVFAVFAAIINGIRGYYFSNEYKESTESRLKEKDDHIKTLEYFSSPHFREAYESTKTLLEERIEQLKIQVDELQEKNVKLNQQAEQARLANETFRAGIPGLAMPEKSRSAIDTFVTGSGNVIREIGQSASHLLVVGEILEKKTDEIFEVASLEITPPPTESITVTDIAKVEVTGPYSDETVNDNNNDDDEPDDPEDVIPDNV